MDPLLRLKGMDAVGGASLPSHETSTYIGWTMLRFRADLSVSMKEEIHLRCTAESAGYICTRLPVCILSPGLIWAIKKDQIHDGLCLHVRVIIYCVDR